MTVDRFVAWTLRHGRALWLVALLLAIPSALRTAWLYGNLRSDLEALLPPSAPSVVALDELRARASGAQFLGVVVDAASPERVPEAERFLDALAARVRTYPRAWVSAVRLGEEDERRFLERNGALYLDVPDLVTVRDRLRARKEYEIARETGSLLDEDEAPPTVSFDDLRAKYDARVPHTARDASGRFVDVSKHLAVLLVELGEYQTGTTTGRRLIDGVKRDIEAVGLPAGMRVGFSGDAAISVEELSSLVTDLSVASAFVIVAVILAIILHYRWWRSVVAALPPLLVAAVLAFGVASLPPFDVTSLNSNTAFLGSIIVGNGINFGLILLARYVEARRAGEDVEPSLVVAIRGARGGTLAAAAAAGTSYASLAATQFRGFRQFGEIGALGMIFAWVTAFVLMPPLVRWLDRGEATRPRPRPERTRVSYWVARAVHRAPRAICLVTAAITVLSLLTAVRFRMTDLETDFSKLRRRDTWTSGEGYWGRRMNEVLGEYLTPFVFLADRTEDATALAARLRAAIGGPELGDRVERVQTIDDVLPTRQPEKLTLAREIEDELTPRVVASLTPAQRDFVDRFLHDEPHPVGLSDLPRTFLLGLREHDGSLGRIVLVYPSVSSTWWDADQMRDFVGALRAMAAESAPPGHAPRLAGSVPLSSDIVEAVRRDAPVASGLSFAGVVLVVFLLLGPRAATLYVAGALLVGVLWLVGASRLFGVHINFANFIAFPITFGIGVDYAVNVVSRWSQDRDAGILSAVRSTGAAVALCSLTTILGYASLLLAANRALFLFGVLAVLGEIACLVVALVSLPALILTLGAWPSSRRHAAPAG